MSSAKIDRRGMLCAAGAGAAALAGGLPALAASAAGGGTKLIILGSRAGPSVGGERYQTSHAIVVDGAVYVVDCGYGATEQFVRAGLKLADIRDIYITHHHPDHNIELGTLIYFAWYAGLDRPLGVYGPPPVKAITEAYLKALKPDVDIWLKDIGHAPMRPIEVHEVSSAGPVMADRNVKVTCALVNHPPVVPALGYRFDTPGRSIVFSGDTTPMESVVRLAKGADVLVHEAIYPEALVPAQAPARGQAADARVSGAGESGSAIAGDPAKLLQHVLQSHSPVVEVGRIAAEAGVKTLVLSHIVPVNAAVTEEMWRAAAARHFKGEIIVARDLMVI
jgi:ribonuclease BN (tRNA processing enzyme)